MVLGMLPYEQNKKIWCLIWSKYGSNLYQNQNGVRYNPKRGFRSLNDVWYDPKTGFQPLTKSKWCQIRSKERIPIFMKIQMMSDMFQSGNSTEKLNWPWAEPNPYMYLIYNPPQVFYFMIIKHANITFKYFPCYPGV